LARCSPEYGLLIELIRPAELHDPFEKISADYSDWSKEFCHPDIERLRQLCHGRERGTALASKNLEQMALREICLQIKPIQRSVLLEHELP
jgi:hypothetical protein